jgi:hypothetical protein
MCGFKHVNIMLFYFDVLCPWQWKIWQFLDIKIHYATICEGDYWIQICKFKQGDYVYLQQTTLTTLDVLITCVIFSLYEVLPFEHYC